MARLHEHQGKAILAGHGLLIPRGAVAGSADEAQAAARAINGPCVVKIQAWTTGRAGLGGVAFADSPEDVARHAARMLGMKIGHFPVTQVLVEEKLDFGHEIFISLSIDDRDRGPVILLSLTGGSGIEERAAAVDRLSCDVIAGPDRAEVHRLIASSALPAPARVAVEEAILTVFRVARAIEARSVEINPLVITRDHRVIAADCRITVDDYAVFRHPELGIDIARELDHPPTQLERIAYQIEQDDHRGTFYFAQMNTVPSPSGLPEGVAESARPGEVRPSALPSLSSSPSKGLIGFHGAGGGGSMMSMDAITHEGFTIANFCDTSGNPSPAKVYRAARIILSQPGLVGYFGSGSGVANQEQYWSAYGLAKAFWELNLDIPAVIRLGGNTEDRAVDILQSACAGLPAKVEGYRKSDPPVKIAARFAVLIAEHQARRSRARQEASDSPSPLNGKRLSVPLPHSIEAEMAFLGSVILDPKVIADALALLNRADNFHDEKHGVIFAAIVEVHDRFRPGDLTRIIDLLRDWGKLSLVGGPEYLTQLTEVVPSGANALHYAKIVSEKARLRRLANAGTEATNGFTPSTQDSTWTPRPPRRPSFVGAPSTPSFPIKQGGVWIDPAAWKTSAPQIIARANGLLKDDAGRPALTVTPAEFLAKDSDMIACEVECRRDGLAAPDGPVFVELDIPGLEKLA